MATTKKKTVKKTKPVKRKKPVKKVAKKAPKKAVKKHVKKAKITKSKKSQKSIKNTDKDLLVRMGRPPKEFTPKLFENLCSILCTEEEIAGIFDISVRTLERKVKGTYKDTFVEVYRRFSSGGKVSLRRAQFEKALAGNPVMLQWLGKSILGQRDKVDLEHTGNMFDGIQVEFLEGRQDNPDNPDNEESG